MTLSNLLRHPIYAGAYSYGRRPTDPRKKIPGRPSTGRTVAPMEEWEVLIKAHFPAYISWADYERNLRQLKANTAQSMGAVRQGSSLLSGLIICGRCGLRMAPHYNNNGQGLRYRCNRMAIDYGEPRCQSLSGKPLDQCLTALIFKALQPAALEISLAVADDLESERLRQRTHWQQRLERAQIETTRARRQYNAVEPENRLVARTLERQWETALAAETQLNNEYDEFLAHQPTVLTTEEREAIQHLAQDIPALWHAETTTAADRQLIVRQLIERVLVTVIEDTEKVHVEVHWLGGHQTKTQINRPVARLDQMSDHRALLQHVKCLQAQGHNAPAIAEILNAESWHPPKRRATYNAPMVRSLLSRQGLGTGTQKQQTTNIKRKAHEWTLKELGMQLQIPEPTLYAWLYKGQLKGRKVKVASRSIWLIHLDDREQEQLRKQRAAQRLWTNKVTDEQQ